MWKTIEASGRRTGCGLPARDALPARTVYIALLVLCLLAYRGILDNGLFNDDFSWLRAARHEMAPGNLLTYRVVDFFRPLVNLSFWIMERSAPGNVPLHYGFNLLMHFLCTALVFRLTRKLLGGARIAFAAAALFAVTSVHAAAVLWISARTTLVSTFFLLASIDALLAPRGAAEPGAPSAPRPGRALRTAGASVLYALALASKEEAIAGFFLVGLLFALSRASAGGPRIRAGGVAAFAVVSAVYLVLRHAFMGGFFQENWGPGPHALRNVAGGFLYQLYPWSVFSIFYPRGTHIAEPAGALVPEMLVAPLAALLIAAGYAARKSFAMNLGVLWALLSLVPVAFFRYRFFSTASISQSRYYYLSSVGTALVMVLLLSMLWSGRSRARRALAAAVFVLLCAGYAVRDRRLEGKWDEYTRYNAGIVGAIVEESDAHPGVGRIAIENPPMAFRYLEDAIALERPGRTVVAVADSADAARHAPCVYISYSGEAPKVMRIMKIEGSP